MSKKYIGDTIDIHAGGEDLIFPHHENEIAQSEACNGEKFANYWMHNGFLNINNKKMSKSAGNFFTVREIGEKNPLLVLRFFMLSAHYRTPLNFSDTLVESSKTVLDRILTAIDLCREMAAKEETGSLSKEETEHFANIEVLVKKFEENEINYKVLDIYKMDIDYCTACGACEKTGYCRIKDEMTPINEEFNKSTGTITVSPMYFSSVSTKVKTVVDRTQAFFSSKYVLGKSSIDRDKFRLGMYIAIGGQPEFENQFLGGQIVMDIFYKSINTDLEYN